MTFCLAFSASPDGIAVISDTRITYGNGYSDDFQKIFFPTDNSLIAVSGHVGALRELLTGVAHCLDTVIPEARIDSLRRLLQQRAQLMKSKVTSDSVSIIYGDVRMQKGPSRCRLARFDVCWTNTGALHFHEQSGASFAAQQASKFPSEKANALPWLCVGMMESTRNFIGNTTMDHVLSVLSLGLEIAETVDKSHIVRHGRTYQQMNIRASSNLTGGSTAIFFDTTGAEDGSFRRKLRNFADARAAKGVHTTADVINILGIAALKRTKDFVNEIPGAMGLDTVSNNWTLATISRRSGVKLLSDEDSNALTMNFALSKSIS